MSKKLHFHFFASPKEIRGNARVEEVEFVRNEFKDGKVSPTNETFTIKAGLIVSAIGYEAEPIAGIPFQSGKVLNSDGHVEIGRAHV